MQQATANRTTNLSLNKSVFPIIILIVFFTAGFFALRGLNINPAKPALSGATLISPAVLEEKYGLRVNLIAVTAAGGMVDLRLKMLDAEKAKTLLQDKKNFPALVIADTGVVLMVSAETQGQAIQFNNGGNLYLLFPNSHGIVKPGTAVAVKFGDFILEPIISK